ncbi:acyl-CoA thioesterase [Deinococcus sp. KNUC1210]|uniref:acyl-CoA thioesterase n=1 Tax=Deinococcus sp. KNUC1210 TaxID=2917691 RepID=UPI001EF07306|nr:thioesterase family protein [Deinococcus sp. KNUC1210]ULH14617.1 acyl-CoA thioesterase [Deinococcus sp. KNUC1210]
MDSASAHRTRIQMRYSDTDMMGHINNAAYAQFLEIARMDYLDGLLPPGVRPAAVVLARLELNYRREVHLGQRVEVLTALTAVGRSSWTYAFQILADDVVSADGSSVQVHVDADTRRPAPLPAEMRRLLTAALPDTATGVLS